jgi:hypothetical protein
MSSSKKIDLQRPPPLLGFCLGRSSNFVGSESGQIQSVKLLQNMVFNRPWALTHCIRTYIYSIVAR